MSKQFVNVEFVINPKKGNEKTRIQHLGELSKYLSEEGFVREKERGLKNNTSLVFDNPEKELILAIYRRGGAYLVAGGLNSKSEVLPSKFLNSDYIDYLVKKLDGIGYEFEVRRQPIRPDD